MTVDGEKIIVQWYKVCLDWFVIGICWILNLDSFTLHHYCFRGRIFWWWSVGWYHKCEFLHHEPFRHLSPKTIIVQKPLQQKHAWTWAVKDLNLFGGQPCTCGDFWCMGKKVHASCWKGFRSLLINHEYNLVKLPPQKKCLLVLVLIFIFI